MVLALLEPGAQARGRLFGALLAFEVEPAVEIAEAHPGEGVDDVAVALDPDQIVLPAIRLIAIHVVQQPLVLIAAQQTLHLAGAVAGGAGVPRRGDAGMYHHDGQVGVLCQQRTVAQPLQQLVPVRCLHQLLQLVFLLERGDAIGDRQQVQIVVAEHGDGSVAQPLDEAQGIERVWAAGDQIAAQPEYVVSGIELGQIQQTAQVVVTALDIANKTVRHETSVDNVGDGQRKGRDGRLELLPRLVLQGITPFHHPKRGGQRHAALIAEGLSLCDHRLLADHAGAFDFQHLAIGIGDEPAPVQQLRRARPQVLDLDEIVELVRVFGIRHITGVWADHDVRSGHGIRPVADPPASWRS